MIFLAGGSISSFRDYPQCAGPLEKTRNVQQDLLVDGTVVGHRETVAIKEYYIKTLVSIETIFYDLVLWRRVAGHGMFDKDIYMAALYLSKDRLDLSKELEAYRFPMSEERQFPGPTAKACAWVRVTADSTTCEISGHVRMVTVHAPCVPDWMPVLIEMYKSLGVLQSIDKYTDISKWLSSQPLHAHLNVSPEHLIEAFRGIVPFSCFRCK